MSDQTFSEDQVIQLIAFALVLAHLGVFVWYWFRRNLTPLQQEVNLVIRVILLIAAYLEVLSIVNALVQGNSVLESVKVAVVSDTGPWNSLV